MGASWRIHDFQQERGCDCDVRTGGDHDNGGTVPTDDEMSCKRQMDKGNKFLNEAGKN